MKRRLLLVISICIGLVTSARSQSIQYSYDEAGNRTARLQASTRSFVSQDDKQDTVPLEEQFIQSRINIYPNPVQTELTIAFSELPELGFGKVLLYDLQGRILLQQTIVSARTVLQMSNFFSEKIWGSME